MSIFITKLRNICLKLFWYLSTFLLTLIFTFSLMLLFNRFNLITDTVLVVSSVSSALLITVATEIYRFIKNRAGKKNKFDIWLHNNKATLILSYVFSCVCFISLRTELSWTYEKAQDMMLLEWTIFGLSITVFVLWHAIVPKQIADRVPEEKNIHNIIQKALLIEQKYDFYENVNDAFTSVSLLSVNAMVLLISTSHIFITCNDITILGQNLAIISFYLCTNTLSDILWSILEPLMLRKKELLKNTNVTQKDLKFVEDTKRKVEEISVLTQMMKDIADVDETLKKQIIAEVCKILLLNLPNKREKNLQSEEDNDVQERN